jgi:hypothetical protein
MSTKIANKKPLKLRQEETAIKQQLENQDGSVSKKAAQTQTASKAAKNRGNNYL